MAIENYHFETVLVEGVFYFLGNPDSNFQGPIKKGFRPIVWISTIHKASSCSFISEIEIALGEFKHVQIVILNQLAFGEKIETGTLLNIGSVSHKIGEFEVSRQLGVWEGQKVP